MGGFSFFCGIVSLQEGLEGLKGLEFWLLALLIGLEQENFLYLLSTWGFLEVF